VFLKKRLVSKTSQPSLILGPRAKFNGSPVGVQILAGVPLFKGRRETVTTSPAKRLTERSIRSRPSTSFMEAHTDWRRELSRKQLVLKRP
jgi:hypothetical protein